MRICFHCRYNLLFSLFFFWSYLLCQIFFEHTIILMPLSDISLKSICGPFLYNYWKYWRAFNISNAYIESCVQSLWDWLVIGSLLGFGFPYTLVLWCFYKIFLFMIPFISVSPTMDISMCMMFERRHVGTYTTHSKKFVRYFQQLEITVTNFTKTPTIVCNCSVFGY